MENILEIFFSCFIVWVKHSHSTVSFKIYFVAAFVVYSTGEEKMNYEIHFENLGLRTIVELKVSKL